MATMMGLHALPGAWPAIDPLAKLTGAAVVGAKEKYPIAQMFEIAQARGIYVDTPDRDHTGMDIDELMPVLADAGVAEEFEVWALFVQPSTRVYTSACYLSLTFNVYLSCMCTDKLRCSRHRVDNQG